METEIVERCRRGDITAFKMIYDQYHQPMLRVALRLLGHQQDAEDAVQKTFIKLYRGIGNFRFQSRFSSYLYKILTRVCFDSLRQKRRFSDLDTVTSTIEPSTDLRIQLEQAISELPERMRLCFVLYAIEELKQDEIAEIMSMTVGGVKATLYQARVRLRKIMQS